MCFEKHRPRSDAKDDWDVASGKSFYLCPRMDPPSARGGPSPYQPPSPFPGVQNHAEARGGFPLLVLPPFSAACSESLRNRANTNINLLLRHATYYSESYLMSSFFPPVEWVLFPVVKCVDSHDSLLLLCVCVYIHFLSSDNGKMASIRGQVCFLVPHHFTQHPTRGSTPSKPSTLEQRRHVLLASGVQGHIPCRAAMPLKKPSPLNCYLRSSQVLSCTPTYAHLHIFTHLLPHSLAKHPTLQGCFRILSFEHYYLF